MKSSKLFRKFLTEDVSFFSLKSSETGNDYFLVNYGVFFAFTSKIIWGVPYLISLDMSEFMARV